jgi:hypothetical protein
MDRTDLLDGAPHPRGPWIRAAIVFYGVILTAAVAWRSGWAGEPLLYASAEAAQAGLSLPTDVALGLVAAGAVIGLSSELTRRTRFGAELARTLAQLLGPLTVAQCVVLALSSGIAEEAFFRGALQPRVGLLAASLLFGAAHLAPRRELLPWTAFSIAAGFLLGGLFEWTGNLVAPVVCHVVVNAVNLRLLTRDAAASFSVRP